MPTIFTRPNFWVLLCSDGFLVGLAYYLAYYLRFDGQIPPEFLSAWQTTVSIVVIIKLIFLYLLDLYRGMWRYTGIHDMLNLLKANLLASAIIISIILILHHFQGFSRGVFAIDAMLSILFLSGFRLSIRLYYTRFNNTNFKSPQSRTKKILIIGAGNMGEKLVREIQGNSRMNYNIVGFVDDNSIKLNQKIHGIQVLGFVGDLTKIVLRFEVDEIIIAITTASAEEMRRILNLCRELNLPFKTMPNMLEMIEGRLTMESIREVRYEDLLGRAQVRLDLSGIEAYLQDRIVMVTGGAGSIGSELCSQICRYRPKKLIIVDQNESGLYDIEIDLRVKFPHQEIFAVLVSIKQKKFLEKIFQDHQPTVIMHAAAYKHVPMMEFHPWEAVFTNVEGTHNLLELSHQFQVERFVLVSTDKAVRPTNIMGASKRVAELLTQAYAANHHQTRYMAVRFGNVVGSIGSVVPLFKKQIKRGGPVTVTHPEVTRYFMTIPEASSLILQAGALGQGGEIFILKMGVPVKITDMAKDIITLSGLQPEVDIKIEYTGLRPGEKLYEELITKGENIIATQHNDIMVLNNDEHNTLEEMNKHIIKLSNIAQQTDVLGLQKAFKAIVPEYHPKKN